MSVFSGEVLQKDFKKMLTLSFLFHFIVFLPLFVVSMKRSTVIIYSPVYSVDLVESPRKARTAKKVAPLKSNNKAADRKKKENLKKREMEALQRELALLQKKKTLDEQKVMAELHAKVEALKAKKSEELLSERMSKLEERVKEKEKTDKLIDDIQKKLAALKESRDSRAEESASREAAERSERSGAVEKNALLISPAVKAYLNVLDEMVRRAWNIPRALLDNKMDLMVQLRIIIEQDGGVSSIVVERPSGKRVFDESVLRAINKAAPLPVPPESLREGKDYYEVGFRFHYFPEGQKGG